MPDLKNLVRQRLEALHLTTPAESDLAEELAQHLEDRYRDLTAAGTVPDIAYRQVLAELDNVHPLRAGIKAGQRQPRYDAVPHGDNRLGSFLGGLWRDFRYALRSMRRGSVFVVFVVLTLALGIGANTTVFTVLNTLILNPLPVRNPAELAAIPAISYPDLKDYQALNDVFRSLAGHTSPRPVTWQAGQGSQGMFSELVTGNYFSTLGLN